MAKKVLIVGAGYAGIEAALTLNKKRKKDEIEITLIDKNPYHTLLTELHEVAGNRISEEGIRIPLRRIFKYTDVNIVMDEITSFDFDNKKYPLRKTHMSTIILSPQWVVHLITLVFRVLKNILFLFGALTMQ